MHADDGLGSTTVLNACSLISGRDLCEEWGWRLHADRDTSPFSTWKNHCKINDGDDNNIINSINSNYYNNGCTLKCQMSPTQQLARCVKPEMHLALLLSEKRETNTRVARSGVTPKYFSNSANDCAALNTSRGRGWTPQLQLIIKTANDTDEGRFFPNSIIQPLQQQNMDKIRFRLKFSKATKGCD